MGPGGRKVGPGGQKLDPDGRKVGPGGRSQLAGNFPDWPPPASPKFPRAWNLGEVLAPEGKGVFLRQSAAPAPIFRLLAPFPFAG